MLDHCIQGFAQIIVEHRGILRRRADVLVAQELLRHLQVAGLRHQPLRRGVSQVMDSEAGDAGGCAGALKRRVEAAIGDPAHRLDATIPARRRRNHEDELVVGVLQREQQVADIDRERDRRELVALAKDGGAPQSMALQRRFTHSMIRQPVRMAKRAIA